MELKRILMVVNSFDGGGAERVMLNLANEFDSQGKEVLYVVLRDQGPYRRLLKKSIRVRKLLTLPRYIGRWLKFLRVNQLTRLINEFSPEIVLCTSTHVNILTTQSFLKAKVRSRLVLREAALLPPFTSESTIRKMKKYYRAADLVIANSIDTSKSLMDADIVKKCPIIIGNPISFTEIDEKCNDKIVLKGFPRIIMAGRLVSSKNFKDGISIFKSILDSYPDAQLYILGIGPEKDFLERLVLTLKLNNNVSFLGFQENPFKFFQAADVFLQTSLREGFGYVLAEAIACGIPAIAYKSKGPMDVIIQHGINGFLVESGNLDEAVKGIKECLSLNFNSSDLRDTIKEFDSGSIAKRYLSHFAQCL